MINLEFSELLAFEELTLQTAAINTGIYIWGFMHNESFVPYYVGIASGKSGMTIARRIMYHRSSYYFHKPNTKYTLLNSHYLLNTFSTDGCFPRDYYQKKNFGEIWEKHLRSLNLTSGYIKQHTIFVNNYLGGLIDKVHNDKKRHDREFRFCYAKLSRSELKDIEPFDNIHSEREIITIAFKLLLERLETFVKYSIKFNTMGHSGSFANHLTSNSSNPNEATGIIFNGSIIQVCINTKNDPKLMNIFHHSENPMSPSKICAIEAINQIKP